jgi:hypothetical protein
MFAALAGIDSRKSKHGNLDGPLNPDELMEKILGETKSEFAGLVTKKFQKADRKCSAWRVAQDNGHSDEELAT